MDSLLSKAWEVQKAVRDKVEAQRIDSAVATQLWEDMLRDVSEGTCIGPFSSASEVTRELGRDDWVPAARFGVVQRGSARGVDDYRANGVNGTVVATEKLQVTSTDNFVGMVRAMDRDCQTELAGWVLDETRACRQVPVHPEQRHFAVVAL